MSAPSHFAGASRNNHPSHQFGKTPVSLPSPARAAIAGAFSGSRRVSIPLQNPATMSASPSTTPGTPSPRGIVPVLAQSTNVVSTLPPKHSSPSSAHSIHTPLRSSASNLTPSSIQGGTAVATHAHVTTLHPYESHGSTPKALACNVLNPMESSSQLISFLADHIETQTTVIQHLFQDYNHVRTAFNELTGVSQVERNLLTSVLRHLDASGSLQSDPTLLAATQRVRNITDAWLIKTRELINKMTLQTQSGYSEVIKCKPLVDAAVTAEQRAIAAEQQLVQLEAEVAKLGAQLHSCIQELDRSKQQSLFHEQHRQNLERNAVKTHEDWTAHVNSLRLIHARELAATQQSSSSVGNVAISTTSVQETELQSQVVTLQQQVATLQQQLTSTQAQRHEDAWHATYYQSYRNYLRDQYKNLVRTERMSSEDFDRWCSEAQKKANADATRREGSI